MRKTYLATLFLSFILLLSGCSTEGSTYKAKSVIGVSENFTEEEIKEAIISVKEKFKDFEDCTLLEIVYDEKKSDNEREDYLRYGKGSRKDLEKENVLVLYSRFEVGSSGNNKNFKGDTVYTNWSWTVIRGEGSEEWTVDDWGY